VSSTTGSRPICYLVQQNLNLLCNSYSQKSIKKYTKRLYSDLKIANFLVAADKGEPKNTYEMLCCKRIFPFLFTKKSPLQNFSKNFLFTLGANRFNSLVIRGFPKVLNFWIIFIFLFVHWYHAFFHLINLFHVGMSDKY